MYVIVGEVLIGIIGLLIFIFILATTKKEVVELVKRREARIDTKLQDIFVIHELIKEKLEVLQIKNREDLKEIFIDIVKIISEKLK